MKSKASKIKDEKGRRILYWLMIGFLVTEIIAIILLHVGCTSRNLNSMLLNGKMLLYLIVFSIVISFPLAVYLYEIKIILIHFLCLVMFIFVFFSSCSIS